MTEVRTREGVQLASDALATDECRTAASPAERAHEVAGGATIKAPTITQIVEREGEWLWLTLQRLGVRREDCGDVVQEVLMVVHRKLGEYDPQRPLRGWLYGICTREASVHRRRAWVRREQPVEPAVMALDHDHSDAHAHGHTGTLDPEGAASSRQQRGRVMAMLDELDPDKRAVLVMYEIEEQSCEQIALATGIPVGTVHSRLHAAREAFRAVIKRWTKREGAGGLR